MADIPDLDREPEAEPRPYNALTHWNLPYNRNAHFVGRDKQIADLRRHFASPRPASHVQAVYGLGGVGKTQIALEYAYRYRDKYSVVWWINADEPASLALAYAKLAERLGLRAREGNTASLDETRHALRRLLDGRNDWLLIFDNADSPEAIRNYLPIERTGHVLITSRNPNWQAIAQPTPLRGFERADSITFLRRRTGHMSPAQDAEADANQLAQALGDLPLALEQAAANIEHAGISFSAYLRRFETHWGELLRMRRPSWEYPDSVAMTWELSFRQVEETSPHAAQLLYFCSFFGPEPIDRSLLAAASAHLLDPLAAVVSEPTLLDASAADLRQYSLIEANERAVTVHRLVAALTRDRLSEEDRRAWAAAAASTVADVFKFNSTDLRTWEQCAAVLPHALAAASHAQAAGAAPALTADLLNDVGRYLYKRAQFDQAKDALRRALALMQGVYGENHPRLSAIVNNLGRVHQRLGERAEARQYFQAAMTLDANAYGQDHPHVAEVVNNFAICLQADGDNATALDYFQWALAVYEKHYGQTHAKVANIVNNLGFAQLAVGKAEEARQHFERALSIAEGTYGPRHPHTAAILANLAQADVALGRAADAKALLERALPIYENSVGRNHPDVARVLSLLGAALAQLKDLPGARQHYDRALATEEAMYGSNSATMAERLLEYGRAFKAVGDLDRAGSCYERANAIWKQVRERQPAQPGSEDAPGLIASPAEQPGIPAGGAT